MHSDAADTPTGVDGGESASHHHRIASPPIVPAPRPARGTLHRALSAALSITVSLSLTASVLGQFDESPPHPGGYVEVRGVRSGPLTPEDLEPVLAVLPDRLRRCAETRFRAERAGMTAAGHDFRLSIDARGRATSEGLEPARDEPPHVRAWLACARRVVRRLRFPARETPSLVMLSLIWTMDDSPPGGGGLL